ncbi:hypothetical protein [Egicoccus halophilus]|uniref:hypothetical protein n=1 Tax=Egicoccus halophilus TaxID=1670830 RepID=UPI00166981F6|nr:hypothetical protein [Egicoccus halophilus]
MLELIGELCAKVLGASSTLLELGSGAAGFAEVVEQGRTASGAAMAPGAWSPPVRASCGLDTHRFERYSPETARTAP